GFSRRSWRHRADRRHGDLFLLGFHTGRRLALIEVPAALRVLPFVEGGRAAFDALVAAFVGDCLALQRADIGPGGYGLRGRTRRQYALESRQEGRQLAGIQIADIRRQPEYDKGGAEQLEYQFF